MKKNLVFWLLIVCLGIQHSFAEMIVTFGGTEYVDGISYSVCFGYYDNEEDKKSRPLYADLSGVEPGNETTSISVPETVTIKYGRDDYTIPVIGVVGMNESICSVSLPNSIQYISDGAFWHCKLLRDVNIPNSVQFLGEGAFADCLSLTSITIPNSIDYISRELFAGCTKLQQVNLPDCLTIIYSGAFLGCKSLTSIKLPEGLEHIYDHIFAESGLTTIEIPSSVKYVDGQAFDNCQSLLYAHVKCPICPRFAYLTSLHTVTLGDMVETISNSAFYGCTNLKTVHFGDNIKYINNEAFAQCVSLTVIELPDKVTNIGNMAFHGCTGLVKVKIPSTIKDIGQFAFGSCTSLKDFYCLATDLPSADGSPFDQSNYRNATLWVYRSCIEQYRSNEPWKYFGEIRPIDGWDGVSMVKTSSNIRHQSFSLDGKKYANKKGVQIIQMVDGTTHKVLSR